MQKAVTNPLKSNYDNTINVLKTAALNPRAHYFSKVLPSENKIQARASLEKCHILPALP